MKYERFTQKVDSGFVSELDCRIAYNKLCAIEDKIEKGKLVDTESYFIIEEHKWAGKNRFLIGKNDIQLSIYDFCETREEAEERLKKLQNEKTTDEKTP